MVWIPCSADTPAEVVVSRLVRWVRPEWTDEEISRLHPSFQERVSLLVELLGGRPRLIVFDNLETWLDPETPAGRPAPLLDSDHRWLFARLAVSAHRATLVITSREDPDLGGGERPTEIRLGRLDAASGRRVLRDAGLERPDATLDEIGERLEWNPFWLRQFAAVAAEAPGDSLDDLLAARGHAQRGAARNAVAAARRLPRPPAAARALGVPHARPHRGAAIFVLGVDGEPAAERETRDALDVLRRRHLVERYGEARWGLHPALHVFVARHGDDRASMHRQAAVYWMQQPVPQGMAARSVDDVRAVIEAHHHLIAAGGVRAAIAWTTQKWFGLTREETVTQFLTRIGLSGLRLEMGEANAAALDREADPVLWAGAQGNLGIAYLELPTGAHAGNLRRAIDAFASVLTVYTHEDFLAEWAMTQDNLDIVRERLRAFEGGP